jgi:hypothetical protein
VKQTGVYIGIDQFILLDYRQDYIVWIGYRI